MRDLLPGERLQAAAAGAFARALDALHEKERVMAELEEAIRDILPMIDKEIEDVGWDLPPALMLVTTEPVGRTSTAVLTRPMQGWPQVLEDISGRDGSMQDCLWVFHKVLSEIPEKILRGVYPPPESIAGVILITEAWQLDTGPEATEEEMDEAREIGKNHKVHEHPNRVEIRFLTLLTRNGNLTGFSHQRYTNKADFVSTDGEIEGAVPELLAKVLDAIT